MKKGRLFIISFSVLFFLLFFVFLFDSPAAPVFSMPSGFYTEPFTVTISSNGKNETIYYTLDGSIPTLESPVYSHPIQVRDRKDDPNDISMITTISYGFVEPVGNVNKIITIRARSFNNLTKTQSPVVTHSYLVGQNIYDRYSLPIISLIMEPEDLFNRERGIYVTGRGPEDAARDGDNYFFWPANYHERGQDWERPVFVEHFDIDGSVRVSQNAGIRIHGGASRSYRQKSFRLYADIKYDELDQFNDSYFPNLFKTTDSNPSIEYQTLILRNSGTDFFSAFMRDVVTQRLVAHTHVETQAIQPVIVFLNGEYWGLYFLYERFDEGYFHTYYSISPQNLIVMENVGNVNIGVIKDQESYQNLLNFVNTQDIENEAIYEEIKNQIDIDNFIDYQIIEIYIANQDWPLTNVKFWKSRVPTDDSGIAFGHDGKWRWLLFDTDDGFNKADLNAMIYATREDLPTDLLRNLLKNAEFQIQFLNRFADHLNSTFLTDRVIQEIDDVQAMLEPEMQEQINRWHSSGSSMENWRENVAFLRSFAIRRPEIMTQHLVEYFNLDGTFLLDLSTNPEKGYLRVNSIDILETTPGVMDPSNFKGNYFKNIPINISAIPYEGFRFSHWEGSIYHQGVNPTIQIKSTCDIYLEPIFIPLD